VADFNADGKKDILVCSAGSSSACVHMGNGNGTFGVSIPFSVGSAPNAITVGDFNGDNKTDIATANQAGANASVLLNNAPTVMVNTSSPILCLGLVANLTATGANTYIWSTGDTTSSIVVSPAITTSFMVMGADTTGCQNAAVLLQNVSNCTSVIQLSDNNSDLNIYPNPFSSQTTITFSETQKNTIIKITDVTGRRVNSEQLIVNSKSVTIDISGYAKGIYFIEVQTEKGVINRKIIKE